MSRDGDDAVVAAAALLEQGAALVHQGLLSEALVLYGGIVERWGWPLSPALQGELARAAGEAGESVKAGSGETVVDPGPVPEEGAPWHEGEMDRVLARTFMCIADTFQRLDRLAAALEAWEVVVARFGEASDPWMMMRVASAMECVGYAAWTLERREEALDTWAALVARFGEASYPEIMRDVASAMGRMGNAFWSLERYEEAVDTFAALIERFADAADPDVRLSVSRALWSEGHLLGVMGRTAEQSELRELLAARHDELLSPEIADPIAWCLLQTGSQCTADGNPTKALSLFDDLLDRFGDATDEDVRLRVASALRQKAYALSVLGRVEEEIATYDEMARRFAAADTAPRIRRVVADGLARKAATLEPLGRLSEAIDALDDAIVLLHGSEDPKHVKQHLSNVVERGRLLWSASRGPEAAMVFESAVPAYRTLVAAQSEFDLDALSRTVFAMVCWVMLLPDPGAAHQSADQLAELLGDVAAERDQPRLPAGPLPEREIAARLAELWNGESWLEFVTVGEDDATLDSMAHHALEIYRETAAWLTGHFAAEVSDPDGPAIAAAWLVRHFADGYALLARRWDQPDRSQISLPTQLLMELGIRQGGVEEWAEAQGHPLELPDSPDLAEEFREDHRHQIQDLDWESQVAPTFIAYVRLYEMLLVLCDSARGRAALQDRRLRDWACGRLADSRNTAGWVGQNLEDAAGVAGARILIAEAYFVATHGAVDSARDLFPSRRQLCEVLTETEAYEWLETQEIELPDWLDPPDS